jgi:hypothetical protein
MTPSLAVIRIQPGQTWVPPIPLPLFLLWIPGLLLAPFVLLGIWILCLVYQLRFWRTLRTLWDLLCGLTGTSVRVWADGKNITVCIL